METKVKLNKKQFEFLKTVAERKHTYYLLYGGRRSSKTFAILCAIIMRAKATKSRHLILRQVFNDVKVAIWFDSFPKVLNTAFPGWIDRLKPDNQYSFYIFPNGSEIWFGGFGGSDKENRIEKILGKEYSTIYYNECSQMNYNSVSMAMGSLAENVGLKQIAFYDCNPPKTSHFSHKLFFKGIDPESRMKIDTSQYFKMQINPADNIDVVGQDYIDNVLKKLPLRQQKRFLLGEYDDDNPNALWIREWIDQNKVFDIPDLTSLVVAIDPPASSSELSAEAGIVIAGMAYMDGIPHYYVLDDVSLRGSPREWAGEAVAAYRKYRADCIVAEKNNGGDMVSAVIQNIADVPVELVWASRGKEIRAEPVSALYESGRVHHVSTFSELESQLCDWQPGDKSPDRLDALVWAITHLHENLGSMPVSLAELESHELWELGL